MELVLSLTGPHFDASAMLVPLMMPRIVHFAPDFEAGQTDVMGSE
jgi:hypothetical protein